MRVVYTALLNIISCWFLHLLSGMHAAVLLISGFTLCRAADKVRLDGDLAPFQSIQAVLGLKVRSVGQKGMCILPQLLPCLADISLRFLGTYGSHTYMQYVFQYNVQNACIALLCICLTPSPAAAALSRHVSHLAWREPP